MIKIDRYRIEPPDIFRSNNSKSAQYELEKAREFFEARKNNRQQRFEFTVYRHPKVRSALTELFYGKCAYCESRISKTAPVDVELYRPKSGIVESPEHPGYWWLAMIWENMLPSCIDCNRIRVHEGIKTGKANRFPLEKESNRAFRPGEESKESPLLLDPCVDNPEEHLIFEKTGIVVSDTLRGQTTIAVLGLNRPGLVESRQETARLVLAQLNLFENLVELNLQNSTAFKSQFGVLQVMLGHQEEFAALKRQLILPWIEKNKKVIDNLVEELPANIRITTPHISKARRHNAKIAFSNFEQDQSSYSLNDKKGREKYRGQRRLIEKIVITNIKAIKSLELDINSTAGRTPWIMLLGENGTGKSTVLQATAITLLGANAFVRLAKANNLKPLDFIRFRCKQGRITIKLSGFSGPHTLEFSRNRVEFSSPIGYKTRIEFNGSDWEIQGFGWDPQTLLLGYGATKLLPRGKNNQSEINKNENFSRVDNLFNPFVPLLNAEMWLLGLNRTQFEDSALILKDLMKLTSDAKLIREKGQIFVIEHGTRVSLHQLSDGYQSMVALTVDILEAALRIWPNLQEAEGIVLLDEVGAHLHPTWKMQIVGSLRKALPAMQFLATTHDPLCLRGIGSGEVAVMARNEDAQIIVLTELPSPADFRVDQLLTSDFFGLNSTIDPDAEVIFDEYYALLALPNLTDSETLRLNDLREELKERRYLGTSLRENLMYDAIDHIISERKREPTIPLSDLKKSAVTEVEKIWNETMKLSIDI